MDRYIYQLIEDLNVAKKKAPVGKPQNTMSNYDIIQELEEIDRIIDEEPDIPMHNIFGIDPIVFPPVEKLSNEQAALLANEILELWEHFNLEAVIPKDFPKHKLYPLLVAKFSEPFLYFPMGHTGIEFCDYDTTQCPFGEKYCMCKDFNLDVDINSFDENLKDKDELPF